MTETSPIRMLTEGTLDALLKTPSPAELKLELTLAELARSRVVLDLMTALLRTFKEFMPSLRSSVDKALALHDRIGVASPCEAPSLVLCEQLASVLRMVQLQIESVPQSSALHAMIAVALADYEKAMRGSTGCGLGGQSDSDIY